MCALVTGVQTCALPILPDEPSAEGLSLSSGGKASLTGAGVAIGSAGSIGVSASGSVDIVGSSVNNNVGPGLAPDPGSIEAPSLPDLYSGDRKSTRLNSSH